VTTHDDEDFDPTDFQPLHTDEGPAPVGGKVPVQLIIKPWDVMMAEPEVPIEWICKDILPRGSMTMVSAYPKVGKSTLIYSMLAHIARGEDFLGKPTMPVTTLVLALDGEHENLVKRRLKRFDTPGNGRVLVAVDHKFRSNVAAKLEVVREDIRNRGIELVIVDTLSKAWVLEDENDAAQVVKAMAPWRALLDDFKDLTLLLIHHDGKSGGRGAKSVRGSSAIFAEVDQLVQLDVPSSTDSYTRELKTISRYDEPIELSIDFEPSLNIYTHTTRSGQRLTIMAKIVEVLAFNDEQKVETIAGSLGVSGQTVFNHLKKKPAFIEWKDGPGRGKPKLYSLTAEAKEKLKQNANALALLEAYA